MLSSDLQKLSVSGRITLYELDATNLGGDVYRWHGHVSHEDIELIFGYTDKTQFTSVNRKTEPVGQDTIVKRDIIWGGETYTPVTIKTDGLEVRGDGRPSAPQLALANQIDGVPNAVTTLCAIYNDFVGAKLRVISVLAKYIDAANFGLGNASADSSQYTEQYWYVEQKTDERRSVVTFELSSPLTAQQKKIPTRTVTNYCTWAVRGNYRGENCRYMGAAMYTEDGEPTDNPALDKCSGILSHCKLRFGENNELSFGGFVSSGLNNR